MTQRQASPPPPVATSPTGPHRRATSNRTTRETLVNVSVDLDGTGAGIALAEPGSAPSGINTGIGFLDHMVDSFARHAKIGLSLTCTGDLHIDDHHTAEDCALALGRAIDEALGDRRGIARFGYAYAPLDESLARVVVDLSGRPHASINLGFRTARVGQIATENLTHFFISLATSMRASIHADLLRGENDHHRAEAAFKALALALRQAIALDARAGDIPSTKGTLS